jgi:hypothetical protein
MRIERQSDGTYNAIRKEFTIGNMPTMMDAIEVALQFIFEARHLEK